MSKQTVGGVQYVPQIAVQYVYLDFDGELTDYNGEILTIEGVEVRDPQLTQARIADILAELNKKYASQNVIFVTERPATAEYSTIFIGKTTAFDQYGNFAGLAETIDEGNANKSDKAFVNLDTAATDSQIIATISHETDHLLGTLNHGGDGLAAYAARYDVSSGVTSTGITLSNDSMFVSSGGVANNTTVNNYGSLTVYSCGTANSTTVNSKGSMTVFSDGNANSILVNKAGNVFVGDGGKINNAVLNAPTHAEECFLTVSAGGYGADITNNGGSIFVYGSVCNVVNSGISNTRYGGDINVRSGGFAKNLIITGTGDLYVYSLGTAENVYVSSGGHLNAGNDDWTHLTQEKWGSVISAVISSAGELHVGPGGLIEDLTILYGGKGWVSSGGTVSNATIDSEGRLYIYSGGTANDIMITSGHGDDSVVVYSGGTASNITVCSGGDLVLRGGVADNIVLSSSTKYTDRTDLYIESGGKANNIKVYRFAWIALSSGTVNSADIFSAGFIDVHSGNSLIVFCASGNVIPRKLGTTTSIDMSFCPTTSII